MREVTCEEFESEVIEASKQKPVLVDFFAVWCSPCLMMGVVLEEVEKKLKEKVKFVKVNVDACRELAMKYGIMSIPCIILFKDGKEASRLIGFRSVDETENWIKSNLG